MTISRLARLGGLNLETIRYYERKSLLPKRPRTASGYRVFPTDTARRLRFVKRAQGVLASGNPRLLSLRVRPAPIVPTFGHGRMRRLRMSTRRFARSRR